MSDVVPLHNQLTVQLANIINDPLSGGDNGLKASAGGVVYSAAKLNEYLTRAYQEVINQIVTRFGLTEETFRLLDGSVQNTDITLSGGAGNLPKDFLWHVALTNNTVTAPPYRFRPPSQLDDLLTDNNPDFKREYTYQYGVLYVFRRTNGDFANAGTDSVKLYYIAADRINTSTGAYASPNASPEVKLNRRWFNAAVYCAAYYALTDTAVVEGSAQSGAQEDAAKFYQNFLNSLPLPQQQAPEQ